MTPGESELSVIQRQTRVLSDTYAALPTTGLRPGDLAYATDRRTLYRWSGAAWEDISIYSDSGAIADIPAAAGMPEGSLYYATDTLVLWQVQSAAWVAIVAQTGWSALGTASFSAAGAQSISFTAHDLIKVIFMITPSATGYLTLILNDITAADYAYRWTDANSIAKVGGSANFRLMTATATYQCIGEALISGRVAGNLKSISLKGSSYIAALSDMLLVGHLANNNADLTKITMDLDAAGDITGEIQVYGKNF